MPPSDERTASAASFEGRDRPGLIAFVTDETSEGAIRNGLGTIEPGLQVRRGDIRAATRAFAKEQTPNALIVDIEGVADAYAALDELASVCTPDTRVLVIGDRNDMGFYRELTQRLGVAEYIYKPLTRDNVVMLFGPHLRRSPVADQGPTRTGRITCVVGARGGVGTTTIATSLALAIADSTRGHVAIVDLNLRGGTAALMLGARASAGLRIALEEPARVDALFLDRVAVEIEPRVRLIAAEEPLDSDPMPTAEGVTRLFTLLQNRFNHIIVDLPRPLGPRDRQVITAARVSVVVLGPDVASLRDAVALRKVITGLTSSRGVMTLLNRDGAIGSLKHRLVVEGLGGEPDASVPDLPRVLPRAANLGRPALRESTVLRRALAPVVQEISGAGAAPRVGVFGRLFGGWR